MNKQHVFAENCMEKWKQLWTKERYLIKKINQFCLTRVIHPSSTDKPLALKFPMELEFRNVGFWEGRKTREPGEKPSEQGREPTTNSTHILRRVWESNPGHIGGRWALSPLRHPMLPIWYM